MINPLELPSMRVYNYFIQSAINQENDMSKIFKTAADALALKNEPVFVPVGTNEFARKRT
jgi:hypothetical protein